jgi:hypothetical protein
MDVLALAATLSQLSIDITTRPLLIHNIYILFLHFITFVKFTFAVAHIEAYCYRVSYYSNKKWEG